MLDAALPQTLQRARGRGAVGMGPAGRLQTLHQSGSAKVMLPNVYGTAPHAVLVNTAGGITGGDRFDWSAEADPDAALTVTSQTAERVYRARNTDTPGEVHTQLVARSGAKLHWLPQETILFDGANLSRRLTVTMSSDAEVLLLEPFVLGRAAMGETVAKASFADQWRVVRDGELIFADAVRLSDDIQAVTHAPAMLAGDRAAASLLLVAPNAEDRLEDVRSTLASTDLTAGASAWNGLLAIRATARDGFTLRRGLITLLTVLRDEDLPRVWHM